MLSNPTILETSVQQTAVIHLTIPRDQIQHEMGPAIQEVMGTLAAQGIAPIGPIFSHHFKMDPGTFDFEVGAPVASAVTPTGRVHASELPATKIARVVYSGPYEGLGDAWGEFGEWIASQGLTPAGSLWESYLAGPETGPDPSGWQTELNRPLVP